MLWWNRCVIIKDILTELIFKDKDNFSIINFLKILVKMFKLSMFT